MLVPQLAAGAAGELAEVRAAAYEAARSVVAAAGQLFVVGADGGPRARSFAPWGVDVGVDVPEPLPLPLLVGGWLTAGRLRSYVAVDPALDAAACAALGAELAAAGPRGGLLVMGDGSARRGPRAPGYLDARSEPFDDDAFAALGDADTAALLALDSALAAELLVTGRAPWQVLAGAADASGVRYAAKLQYADAPYGVGYAVATWSADGV
jgi:hypothetical protein